tara:strand:+ start:2252 stop:2521 length:270 start_codon:yes stop_codon:yes gene_type:complete
MVMAGIRNIKTHGATANSVSILAYPLSKTLLFPGKIHINKPIVVRNTTITIYPMRDPRKLCISFFKRLLIKFVIAIGLKASKITNLNRV